MARNWSTPESWTDEKAVSVTRLQAISDNLQFLLDTLYAKMASATISGGTLTLTENEGVYALSGEGGAADTLTDISGGQDGDIIILWYAGETITIAESGNLDNGDYGSFDLSDASHFVTYYRESSVWRLKSTSVHNKAIHDSLGIDADTLDGLEGAAYELLSELHGNDGGSKTISAGAISISGEGAVFYTISAESGSDDDLTDINGAETDQIIGIKPALGDTITLKTTGNIDPPSGEDLELDDSDTYTFLFWNGTSWNTVGGAGGGGGIAYETQSGDFTAEEGVGYILTKDTLQTVTLPASPTLGERIVLIGEGDNGWELKTNASADAQKVFNGDIESETSSSSSIKIIESQTNSPKATVSLICVETGATDVWVVEWEVDIHVVPNNYFGDGSDGDATLSSDQDLSSTQDGDYVLKQYASLVINSGVTLSVANRCKGLFIYVQGDCDIQGTLSMSKKGAYADPSAEGVASTGIRLPMIKSGQADSLASADFTGCGSAVVNAVANQPGISGDGKIYKIEREGGAGGADPGYGGANGNNGGTKTWGSGGGGSGGIASNTNSQGIAGADGTCFSGGSAGGGADRGGSEADAGSSNGGPGGDGANGDDACGGGAGNPGGAGYQGGTDGADGTGGIIWLVVGGDLTIGGSGRLEANGGDGGEGGSGGASGGGSGGGVIIALYRGTLTNDGVVQANGGNGGTGGYDGGDGGAGYTLVEQVD